MILYYRIPTATFRYFHGQLPRSTAHNPGPLALQAPVQLLQAMHTAVSRYAVSPSAW